MCQCRQLGLPSLNVRIRLHHKSDVDSVLVSVGYMLPNLEESL